MCLFTPQREDSSKKPEDDDGIESCGRNDQKGTSQDEVSSGKVRIENRILILNSRILFQSGLVFGVAVIAKAQLFCLSKTQQSFEKQNQYLLFSLFFFLMFITEPDTTTSDYPAEKVLLET